VVRGIEVVASVIAALFVVGIGVGVLIVIALPTLRRRRDSRYMRWNERRRRYGLPPDYGDDDGPGRPEPPPGPDAEGPPPWPRRRG
jgi:hypothetical protein